MMPKSLSSLKYRLVLLVLWMATGPSCSLYQSEGRDFLEENGKNFGDQKALSSWVRSRAQWDCDSHTSCVLGFEDREWSYSCGSMADEDQIEPKDYVEFPKLELFRDKDLVRLWKAPQETSQLKSKDASLRWGCQRATD